VKYIEESKTPAAQVADPSALTLGSGDKNTDASAVQTELDKAGSYLATVSAYARGIKSQYNIINQKIETAKNVESVITSADESIEIAKATERSIRHQSTAIMMAQANMARASILKLLQF
jgi:flagellin-like hook-associated protein FlgL